MSVLRSLNYKGVPLQTGITGGIGSGKTTVCRIFECLGVPVYAADERARWLSNHDPGIKEEVIGLLGREAYDAEGTYNRNFVASRVFKNDALLRALNNIIHPRVAADTQTWLASVAGTPYVLKEAALMNKAGEKNSLDYVVVVHAAESLRIRRVLHRDPHRTASEVRAIINSQITEKERLALADFVIHNDEESVLIPQVLALHEQLLASAAQRAR